MVLGVFLDLGLEMSLWTGHKICQAISYLYYGYQETSEEKILKELQDLKKDNAELKLEILSLRKSKDDANKE